MEEVVCPKIHDPNPTLLSPNPTLRKGMLALEAGYSPSHRVTI